MAPTNSSLVDITGTSDSSFTGTVFAPASKCNVGGNAAPDVIASQVVCWKIDAGGSVDVHMSFNPEEQFQFTASVDFVK
jgi:hypothetical protein